MSFDINGELHKIYICAICLYILATVFSFLFTVEVISRRENYDLDNVFGFILFFVGILPMLIAIIFCFTAITICIMAHSALGYLT